MNYEAIIVGAGPAGSRLAYQLAKQGRQVLLLEKERFPRYKPCGGGLTAKVKEMADLPVDEAVEDIAGGVTFSWRGERQVSVTVEWPVGYLVRREKFDQLLLEAAKKAGAEVKEGVKVYDLRPVTGGVEVIGDGGVWQAPLVVGADGVNSRVARLLGLQTGKKGLCLEAEFDLDDAAPQPYGHRLYLDAAALPRGYGWVFPKDHGLSVGVGSFSLRRDLRSLFHNFITREHLTGYKITKLRGYLLPAEGGKSRPVYHQYGLLLGDAAGLVDPLTGEGIYYALKSADLAAVAFAEHPRQPRKITRTYAELLKGKIRNELRIAQRLQSPVYSFVPVIYSILERKPELGRRVAEILAGRRSYSDLLGYLGEIGFWQQIRGVRGGSSV